MLKMISLLMLFVLLTASSAVGQEDDHDHSHSPYQFNWKHETAIAAATVVYFGGGVALDYTRSGLTHDQIAALDPNDVNRFDRRAIGNSLEKGTLVSDILLGTSFVLPTAVLAVKRCRADALLIGLMWVEVAGLTLGTTEYVKSLVLRTRPFAYDPNVSIEEKTDRDTRMSFFSGHTSATAAFSFFGAKVFSDYSDNTLHKTLVWSLAITLPAVVGYLRVRASRHFPTDVIAGYAIGATIGYMVPFLHKRKPIVEGMTLTPYSSGRKDLGVYMSYTF